MVCKLVVINSCNHGVLRASEYQVALYVNYH
jgi:hypothetical protein